MKKKDFFQNFTKNTFLYFFIKYLLIVFKYIQQRISAQLITNIFIEQVFFGHIRGIECCQKCTFQNISGKMKEKNQIQKIYFTFSF